MKKIVSIFLTAALLFSLGACTSSESGGEPEPTREPASVEDQLALLVANKDVWLAKDSLYPAFYAVTDLNGNGRLELICDEPGDDWSNVDTFYEISEDGETLEKLAFPFGEDHSHPDLADQDAFRMYVGQEGRYLVANDNIYMGPVQAADYQAYHVQDFLFLGENGVEAGDIAWCMMIDEDTNGDTLSEYHIYYYTGGDANEPLDGEGYRNAASGQFPGYNEEVCRIAWWTLGDDTEADEEALTTGLTYSWNGFSVEPDDAQFAELATDPYYDFYAAGAGGAKIYREGEEAPYFPSFRDIYGTWYLQSAWNDDGITYVGAGLSTGELNILDSGQLYMNYNNENDPRGPYLITEMNMTSDSLAQGEAADDWVIVYESDDGMWQMQLRPDPDNDAMYVTWYEWPDGDRSAEPTGMNLVYSRIAG